MTRTAIPRRIKYVPSARQFLVTQRTNNNNNNNNNLNTKEQIMNTTTRRTDKRTVTKAGRVIVHGRSGTSATFGAVELIPVPGHEMGKLIGRGCNNLASIQARSGMARIEVNDRRGGLELFGGVAKVRAAAVLIEG